MITEKLLEKCENISDAIRKIIEDGKVEAQFTQLVIFENFVNKYYEMCCEFSKNVEAYEAVERIYERTFGERKYKNFESFTTVLRRKIKDNKTLE